jgi:hypothetical protein
MGANAQTSVPTFTTGQVLTAEQQNESARTGVPVFATTGTRDAAFGGTGEKTLAEGQLAYVEGTGLQSYNGTSWITWGAAPSAGALVYITGATFSAATSVSLPTNTFTSTYRNYRVIWQITSTTSNNCALTQRMRASGSDITTARYFQSSPGSNYSGTASNQGDVTTSSWTLGTTDASDSGAVMVLDVFGPAVAERWKMLAGNWMFYNSASAIVGRALSLQFLPSSGTQTYDSLTWISSVASSITGNYRVYGYADS